ncbi:MAG: Gfo/Idh/MocA family oxidoreductase [Chloroflexi bacterium]|nr:Gfo/Idh/MocA family oxidoreductase [Chloroflexota bacterium]MBU1751179.1 Gfo/Idh/MocA family oxidoreductase [Chloroflexota bacterium]
METSTPTVGVIGTGYWGKNLVRNFYQLGALAAICDSEPACLSSYEASHPEVPKRLAYSEVFGDPSVQAVAIATPAETHYRLVREALLADKDVMVEKPLCLEEGQATELIALAAERRRVLMVGHLLRYHPAFVKLQELVKNGELGRVYYIYSNRLNLGRIRREENILWSFAPHDVSAILALAGDLPETVVSRGGNYLHEHIADVTVSVLEFASGLRAHIFVSWLHPYKEQRLVVVSDRQMAVFNDVAPAGQKLLLYPHQIEWRDQVPTPHKAEAIPVAVDDTEPLRLECQHFLDCMRTRSTPLTDGEEGRRVLQVLNACQRSLDQDKVVSLAGAQASRFYAHPTAVIDQPCEIGEGTKVWHFAHVMAGARIGRQCVLGQNVLVAPDVTIGDNVKIQNNVAVYTGVVLEDDVFCGPSMVFTNVINPRSHVSRKHEFKPTVVRRGATIGANATIVCGHEIGAYAFVGAGAVVTRDVPAYALVVGNPGRLAGWMCQCAEKLAFDGDQATCEKCGTRYRREKAHQVVCLPHT